MVSFGHAAYFGVGGYVVGILNSHFASGDPWLGFIPGTNQLLISLPAAMIVSGLCARAWRAVAAYDGVPFIMITLAFAQMLFFLFVSLKTYGGDDGLIVRRRNVLFDLSMADDTVFYFVRTTSRSYISSCLRGWSDRGSDSSSAACARTSAARCDRYFDLPVQAHRVRYRGDGCGARRRADGELLEVRSPRHAALDPVGRTMIMVIVGGTGTRDRACGRRHRVGRARDVSDRLDGALEIFSRPDPHRDRAVHEWRYSCRVCKKGFLSVAEALLQVTDLTKRFGGLLANNALSLDIGAGELHAVIGPNGAGKTTFISQLAGELHQDEGTIHLRREIAPGRRPAASIMVSRALSRSAAVDGLYRMRQCHDCRTGTERTLLSLLDRTRVAKCGTSAAIDARSRRLDTRAKYSSTHCRMASRNSSNSRSRSRPHHACCCSTSRWLGSARLNAPG